MNIQNISKKDSSVTVELTADDLVLICNAMYAQRNDKSKENFLRLYSDMMIARDFCQYGHLDNFALHTIATCRNEIGEGLSGVLPNKDVDTLTDYLVMNDIVMAIGNSDWCQIYKKVTGEDGLKKLKDKLKLKNQ